MMAAAKKGKHRFAHRPINALGNPRQRRGKYQVTGDDWQPEQVDVCECVRCGTRVLANAPETARAVCNAKGIDCDEVIVEAVHSL